MKKSFLLVLIFIITSMAAYASIPSSHPDLPSYFSKRFVSLDYNGNQYYIDLKEVQAVLLDTQGLVSLKHAPIQAGTWGKDYYWIFFKNGTWVAAKPETEAKDKWTEYLNFLKEHPQFLTVP